MTNLLRPFVWAAVFSVSFCGTGAGTAFAVLGETEAELIKRYGKRGFVLDEKSVPNGKIITWTDHPDYTLIVCLVNDRSAHEMYTLERPAADRDCKVIQQLLAANANGEKWVPLSDAAIPAINSLQGMKGDQFPQFRYVWNQKESGCQAFVHKDDPSHFEVNSPVWNEVLKNSQK